MKMTTNQIKTAFLLGAFDRFNYGDLLFPLVVSNEIKTYNSKLTTSVHALIDSDLSCYGAMKTRALSAIYHPNELKPGDSVIFAGGGIIGVDWTYMYANLLGKTGNAILYYLSRLVGAAPVNRLCRRRFGARAPFPWVAGPEDFPVPVHIAYNAVGGSEFAKLDPTVQDRTLDRLGRANYLSVRDSETKRLFSSLEKKLTVELAPDPAILMSEQFPISFLETQASPHHLEIIDSGSYVCFQANLGYVQKHQENIVTALETIHNKYGLRAVLLPIGRYVGLDDQIALNRIKEKLSTPVELVSDQATLFEIMLTIAKAKLFLGTSLHGNITSQSFGVPHLGLSDHPCKVDYYLKTWDLPEQQRCVRTNEIPEYVKNVLSISHNTLQMKRSELITRSHDNFRKMAQACEIN